jgi:hypothetical protein
MTRMRLFLDGLALGAGLMYFFDPVKGRTRRARVRDKFAHLQHEAEHQASIVQRDLTNRAQGWWARLGAMIFPPRPVSDETLEARIRARIGHLVPHPRSVEIRCRGGHVSLRGRVLPQEAETLLHHVPRVPGVLEVDSQLEIIDESSEELGQGDLHPPRAAARLRRNWPPAVRFLVGATSAASYAYGTVRRDRVCKLLGLAGLGLLACEVSGILEELQQQPTESGEPRKRPADEPAAADEPIRQPMHAR